MQGTERDACIATLGHDLGTPITVIAGRATLLLRELGDERSRGHVEAILEQCRRMTARIERALVVDSLDRAPMGPSRDASRLADPVTRGEGDYLAVPEMTGVPAAREDST